MNVYMKEIIKILGRITGSYMTEKSLAITFFAGHPEIALVWAIAKAIQK